MNAPPNPPPNPRRHPHTQGLSLVETLIATSLSVVGVGLLTLGITNQLRNQSEQGQNSNTKNSIRRIADTLNTQVQNGTMVAVRNGTDKRASILFIDEANALNVSASSNFTAANEVSFTGGRGSFRTGDEALMVNANGDAVLFTVTDDISSNDPTRILRHDGCPNTIPFTPGTRVFKASTFAFALGTQIGSGYTADSLYQQRTGSGWEEVAYKLKTFNIKYGYTATDGNTAENLTAAGGRDDIRANMVRKDGREYRLSHLSLQLAQDSLIDRAYNTSIPLQTTRLQVNSIKQCGLTAAMTGTNAGGLRILVNSPDVITPNVQISGPAGFTQTLNGTSPDAAPWNNLTPGQYTAAAAEISNNNTIWVPEIQGNPAGVTSWNGSTITVQYNPALAPFTVNVSGLPAGTLGRITLTARDISCPAWSTCIEDPTEPQATLRNGESITLNVESVRTLNLAPGTYEVGVAAVNGTDGELYAPNPEPPSTITLTSRQPGSLNVTYARVTGGLVVQYYGKPSSSANATIRGPAGFTLDVMLPNGASKVLPTATPGVYNVSGVNNASETLVARSATVYPNSRATIVLRDPSTMYICPNGQPASGPEECPRCPDGSLSPASGTCGSGEPALCPDGSPMNNGRCPTTTDADSPQPQVEDYDRCPGAGPIMCIDGEDDKAIGGPVYVVVDGVRIDLTEYDTYGTEIQLPDGSVMTVENLLSTYPAEGGDILRIQSRADYAECYSVSCQSNSITPSDECTLYARNCNDNGGSETGDPVDYGDNNSDPYDPNPAPGEIGPPAPRPPADPPADPPAPEPADPPGGGYNPTQPYPCETC